MLGQEPRREDHIDPDSARRRLHLREVRSESLAYDGIGIDLRAARARSGDELREVAQKLRIKESYLRAIEEGQFSALPGHVYVYGFLRSYARHLGLDEDVVIDRYKAETSDPRPEGRLEFPSAMDRGRMPTGRLLLGGLLVAALVYAGWFVLTGEQRRAAERVSPVPERLVAEAPQAPAAPAFRSEPATPAASDATAVAVASAATPVAAMPAAVDTPTPGDTPERAAAAAGGVSPPPSPQTADAPSAARTARATENAAQAAALQPRELSAPPQAPVLPQRTSVVASASAHEAAPPPAPAAPVPEPEETAASAAPPAANPVEPRAAVSPDPVRRAAPAQAEAAAPDGPEIEVTRLAPPPAAAAVLPPIPESGAAPAAQPSGYVPRVFGAGNENARVVIVATADSWVQVRTSGGELLLTRVLRTGDRYLVPDRPGLFMMTGNAGALTVTVDGEPVPPLGPAGEIGRDIPLDPASLREGRRAAR